MKPDELARYREKWREAPRGSDMDGRVFSTDLLALADADLVAAWDAMAARRYAGEIGWLAPLYADTFRGRQVLELGSGLGFDGLRFATGGRRTVTSLSASKVRPSVRVNWATTRSRSVEGQSFHGSTTK